MSLGKSSFAESSTRKARCVAGLILLVFWSQLGAVNFPLRWRWSNPSPHGGNVVDMAYSPMLSLGVQVAERGQIFTSGDLSLWLPRDTFLTNALRAVAFFGPRIVVTGEAGAVLYADDLTLKLSEVPRILRTTKILS